MITSSCLSTSTHLISPTEIAGSASLRCIDPVLRKRAKPRPIMKGFAVNLALMRIIVNCKG